MICKRYFVSGRVQGVFYRANTQREAKSLGLTGWVRNRSDGRVEVFACGDEPALADFEKWLETGPEYAKVTNIRVVTEKPSATPSAFAVLPTL
jgi:acylphosphatase